MPRKTETEVRYLHVPARRGPERFGQRESSSEREKDRGGEVIEEEDSIASWYIVNQHLGLPTLLNENRTQGKLCG